MARRSISSRSAGDHSIWCGVSAGLVALALSLCGCDANSSDPRGERVGVRGTVTLDGIPLPSGRIVFESNQGRGALKATARVERGRFELSSQAGPLPGPARIEIYPEPIELEELEAARQGDPRRHVALKPVHIPARYNVRSTLTAEIRPEGGVNELTFTLTSK